jgi:hypothetical protein
MKSLHRRKNRAELAENTFEPAPAKPSKRKPPQQLPISLSTEQKSMPEKPLNPWLNRILQKIYADRAAAEDALKARRTISSPNDDSGERHVVQGPDGSWHIVPGPGPTKLNEFFDAL